MTRYEHAGGAKATSLASGISDAATSITGNDLTGWPTGATGPFWFTLNRGNSSEERCTATSRTGNVLSGVTRGLDGTSASSHSSGDSLEHTTSAVEFDKFDAHAEGDGTGLHVAADITNTPAGDIAATTVQAAIDELDTDKLAKAGGTMTGALTLSGAPSVDLHAATKKYVDDSAASTVKKAGTLVGTRAAINLIEGSNVTLTVTDDSANDEIDVTVAAAGAHMEAKNTAGSASEESVTWTTAFASTPVVVTSVVPGGIAAYFSSVTSRSTTGASVKSHSDAGAGVSAVKTVIAREAT